MTETITTDTLPHAAIDGDLSPNLLLSLIVAILAPMFLGVAGGDIQSARIAAIETVDAYRSRNNADLIAIAQIIACGLAALGSLSLSMGDDISIHVALQLRGNANALNRSAELNRRAIRQGPSHTTMPGDIAAEADQARYEAEALTSLAAAQKLVAAAQSNSQDPQPPSTPPAATPPAATQPVAAPMITDRQKDAMWAAAMTEVAQEFTATLPSLPPLERKLVSRRVAALSSTANELIAGRPLPPFRMRSG